MTFEKLGEDRVLITLRDDDIKALGLELENLSPNNPDHEKKLRKLLLLACFDAGIDLRGRRFLLEALPSKTGYLLFVHAQRIHSGKRYRIKRQTTLPVCFFQTTDEMLDGLNALSRSVVRIPSNTLYQYKGGYCLIFSYPLLPKTAERLLTEYGSLQELSRLSLALIREHGKVLIQDNAVAFFAQAV